MKDLGNTWVERAMAPVLLAVLVFAYWAAENPYDPFSLIPSLILGAVYSIPVVIVGALVLWCVRRAAWRYTLVARSKERHERRKLFLTELDAREGAREWPHELHEKGFDLEDIKVLSRREWRERETISEGSLEGI